MKGQIAAAQALDDETARLSRRALLPGSTRLVLSQMPRRLCLAEAASRIADAYNVLHGGRFNLVVRRGGAVLFQVDDRGFPFTVSGGETVYAAMERTLLFVHAALCLTTPGVASDALIGVALRRPRGPAAVPFARLGRVRYGAAVYGLRYDARLADELVERRPHHELTYEAAVAMQVAIVEAAEAPRGPSTTSRVRRLLHEGATRQDEVAALLGISPATLRRRLRDEEGCFRKLREEALTAKARPMLASGLSLPVIATRLGFADVRSFNRAFKAWTGQTPSAARRTGPEGGRCERNSPLLPSDSVVSDRFGPV